MQEIEDLVNWAKSNLSMSTKSLLWLNQALQELIEKILAAASENKALVTQRMVSFVVCLPMHMLLIFNQIAFHKALLNDVIGKLNPEKKYFKVKPLLYLLPYFRDQSDMVS